MDWTLNICHFDFNAPRNLHVFQNIVFSCLLVTTLSNLMFWSWENVSVWKRHGFLSTFSVGQKTSYLEKYLKGTGIYLFYCVGNSFVNIILIGPEPSTQCLSLFLGTGELCPKGLSKTLTTHFHLRSLSLHGSSTGQYKVDTWII